MEKVKTDDFKTWLFFAKFMFCMKLRLLLSWIVLKDSFSKIAILMQTRLGSGQVPLLWVTDMDCNHFWLKDANLLKYLPICIDLI